MQMADNKLKSMYCSLGKSQQGDILHPTINSTSMYMAIRWHQKSEENNIHSEFPAENSQGESPKPACDACLAGAIKAIFSRE
jgi:hypothetical protein